MTQTVIRPTVPDTFPAEWAAPQPGRFHLHRFRFQSVEPSGHSVYACRCGVAKAAI